ncbi:unnamed protein product, partial [Closterium sp. NIES-53]
RLEQRAHGRLAQRAHGRLAQRSHGRLELLASRRPPPSTSPNYPTPNSHSRCYTASSTPPSPPLSTTPPAPTRPPPLSGSCSIGRRRRRRSRERHTMRSPPYPLPPNPNSGEWGVGGTSLPPFYVLVYIDNLVFATTDTEALTLVKSELQKRHTCTNLGPSALQLPVLLAIAHSSVYQPLALSSTFGRVLRRTWGSCLEDGVQLSSLDTQTLLG